LAGRARTSNYGNPFIGIYGACNERLMLLGIPCSPKLESACAKALGVEVRRVSVDGPGLLGLYCALNSNGIVVPAHAGKAEVARLKGLGLNIHRVRGRMSACGNNVLANDRGAVANPGLPKAEVRRMADCLGVEVVQMKVANYVTVGAVCMATNRGFLAHPRAGEQDVRALESALRVPGSVGTANLGVPFVGLCALANSRGYVVGEGTTGFEMGRFDEALGLIE
jgi:translation initiation factor 6